MGSLCGMWKPWAGGAGPSVQARHWTEAVSKQLERDIGLKLDSSFCFCFEVEKAKVCLPLREKILMGLRGKEKR